MDFFAGQERARQASRLLLILFAFAITLVVAIVYLALLPLFGQGDIWQPGLFVGTALAVGGTILAGSLLRIATLASGGGAAVARALGGRLVERSTREDKEVRLLNLVDEMAIAAGVPVPQVFILDEADGINAFAAGNRPNVAAIGLTRGAIDKLKRDELQGVIAHEFSHILNGDMQLNLRLLGVLHGLFMLASGGRLLLQNGGRADRGRTLMILLGLALTVSGWLGVFIGRLIRAAVSRQREFLADAAAVQFTRNPQGITSALRRIATHGSDIDHPAAEEVSHMLLDNGRFNRWLATHPPLSERIRRLEGSHFQPLPSTPPIASAPPAARAPAAELASAFTASIAQPAASGLDGARQLIGELPVELGERLRSATPEEGMLALLLSRDSAERERQASLIGKALGAPCRQRILALPSAHEGQRLPLLELALPALQARPLAERERFIALADALVRSDGRISLSEYIVVRLLRDGLLPRPPSPPLSGPGELAGHCALLLSLLARSGQAESEAAAAFAAGAALAPADGLHLRSLSGVRSDTLDQALAMLAATSPAYRKRLLMALHAVANHDGRLIAREQELLALICSALDCPPPNAPPAPAQTTAPAPGTASQLAATAAPDDFRLADQTPLQALLIANLIPVFGVIFFDWDARNVLLLYWLENLVIGAYTLLRMLATHKWRALGAAAFFSFHFSFFCGGHGMFVFALSGLGSEGMNDPLDNFWPENDDLAFLIPLQMLFAILGWMLSEAPGMLGLPLLAFIVSHGISAYTHHVVLREDDGRDVDAIMWDPYGRIFLLHIALLFGSFIIIFSGGGGIWPVLLLLIGFKTAFDVHQHRRSHEKRQAARSATLEVGDSGSDGGGD